LEYKCGGQKQWRHVQDPHKIAARVEGVIKTTEGGERERRRHKAPERAKGEYWHRRVEAFIQQARK